ncbi:hypothetical protein KPL39_08990 [Clostridium gasigenes]|uniref:hypothetical protein n=1 Tax=Clostridium gasigenes TaxID=94869 RepID=UPI001C0CFE11|nr:hypothetical protein [Clostridium gasigenes]MBU3136405.1 hypothetical protein [Clostridium gasigenes]
MKSLENHFKIDYSFYESILKIGYEKYEFMGENLVQFLIRLPIYIPIVENSSITIKFDEKSAVSFLFYSIKFKKPFFTSATDIDTMNCEEKYTVVEMAYITEHYFEISDIELNKVFDKLINKLNEVILAIMIKTRNHNLYKINIEMLESKIIYRCIDLDRGCEITSGIFILNDNSLIEEKMIDQEKIRDILWFSENVVSKNINPFITSEELMLASLRERDIGFNKEAIMLAQSSVESFLRTLYKCFLKDEGKKEEEINIIIENKPFISIVKTEISTRIGGKWNIKSYGVVGNWYRDTYIVRNKVSHGGLSPSLSETRLAIQRANELRIYVIQLLKSKSNIYQNIIIYFEK